MVVQNLFEYFLSFLCAFGATFGCSIIFNNSKKDVFWGSVIGGIGWLVYKISNNYTTPIVSYFYGALSVSFLSEIFAILLRKPGTVFLLPGLLPLVPGGGMFQTMEAAVSGDMEKSLTIGFSTLSAAGAIAIGIAFSAALERIFHNLRRQKYYEQKKK